MPKFGKLPARYLFALNPPFRRAAEKHPNEGVDDECAP
jgi:hypothetical protein